MKINPSFIPVAAIFTITLVSADPAINGASHLIGHYSDKQLGEIDSIALPKTFLYDSAGKLIPQEEWPEELSTLKKEVGDAFCCVSDANTPSIGNGPPANCVKIVYGLDVVKNFHGLLDSSNRPISMHSLPPHKWMLVEYSASWCPSCVQEKKLLEQFFGTAMDSGDYVWVTIDMERLIEAKEAAKSSKPEQPK